MVLAESESHLLLKKLGVLNLRLLGYSIYQIQEEYRILIGQKPYIIDVVALTPNYRVAIECGEVKPEKMEALVTVFNEVYHLSYASAVESVISFMHKYSELEVLSGHFQTQVNMLTKERDILKADLERCLGRLKEYDEAVMTNVEKIMRGLSLREKIPREDMLRVRVSKPVLQQFIDFHKERRFRIMEDCLIYLLQSTRKQEATHALRVAA